MACHPCYGDNPCSERIIELDQEVQDLRTALRTSIIEQQKLLVTAMRPSTSKEFTKSIKTLDLALDVVAPPLPLAPRDDE